MRLLHRTLIVLLVLLPAISSNRFSMAAPVMPGDQPGITVTADGLVLEWRAPAVQVQVQQDGTSRVLMPGYEQVRQPGAPRVPFSAVLVALPPGAQPVIELLRMDETQIDLPAPLELAEIPAGVQRAPNGQVLGGAFIPAAQSARFNLEPVVLEPLGNLRGVQMARLVFYPARPQGEHLQLTRHVQVALHFNSSAGRSLSGSRTYDPLHSAIQPAVVNPQHFQPGPAQINSTAYQPALSEAGPMAAIEVEQAGLTAITYHDLQAIGFPVAGVNPQHLRLSRAGVQIPLEWEGDLDSVFEPGERLLFYAQPRFSRWTSTDVYFLSQADSPGASIANRSADPDSLPSGAAWVEVTAEENRLYTPDCFCAPIPAGRDGDRWVWDNLQWPTKQTAAAAIGLSNVNTGQPAVLNLWLIGYTDIPAASIDHHVDVFLNGVDLGEIQWNGKQAVEASFSIPTSTLKNGDNQLELSLPGISGINVEGVWLDAFSIRYSRSSAASGDAVFITGEATPHAYTLGLSHTNGLRAYDVTDPDQPYRLDGLTTGQGSTITLGDPASGGPYRYWITNETGIASPARLRLVAGLQAGGVTPGADYIILTHAAFLPALDGLVALRQQQGLSVVVEDVQAIYDAFGDGRPEPHAIRAFLTHAYASWNPKPVYVLLVGDGTSDPKRYSEASSHTFIPPYLADVEPWAGETASDNRYVTLDGEDNLPDMLIGRLPVNSLAEAQTVVAKIVQYEQDPAPGDWTQLATFVADDQDGGGDFSALTDEIVNSFFAPPRTARRLYLQPPGTSAEDVRQGLFEDWNAGTSLLMYTGHASIHQWAVEQFLHINDVDSLGNGARLPLLLEMTCFTSSFQVPGLQTLDEALLRHPAGGVIAAWGSTGLGISTGHKDLADGFLRTIFHQPGADLGKAALAGKLNLAVHSPEFSDLIDTFTLLGDPATKLMLETGSKPIYMPIIQNNF